MDDLISRQAAIEALDVLCQEHRYKIPGKRETYSQYNEAWQDALDRAEGAIFNLPTVQPDHNADVSKKAERAAEIAQNVQNEDLIQRKMAIDALHAEIVKRRIVNDANDGMLDEFDIESVLRKLPSAQREQSSEIQDILDYLDTALHPIISPEHWNVYSELHNMISMLPSAQPDHVADIGKKAEGDCISRMAAIDALARMMPRSYTPDGSHPADEEIFRVQEVFADCIEALEILPSVQPEPHWIPCSERLPEKSCYCLTSNEYSNVCEDFYWGDDGFEKANKYHYEVLAWKPLPEPYRGGDTE